MKSAYIMFVKNDNIIYNISAFDKFGGFYYGDKTGQC